ncbi:MAG TPA: GNAT family N-acetyltransferase [Gaiellaceae bacterium]|nr:GNAT family N-acetyltransferase [Gaiellaceae bacterium]
MSAELPRELREYAYTPDRFAALSDELTRFADERVCVLEGSTFASVSGVRVAADELPGLVEEVRARVPADKHPHWWLDPETEPADAAERLLELGLRTPSDEHEWLQAVVTTEPPAETPGVDVRRVETPAEFVQARTILWDVAGRDEAWRARERPRLESMFEAHERSGTLSHFVAYLDGKPAATASSVHSDRGSFLIGGCVLPEARGHGLYRALVRARWDAAVERGRPALISHAVPETSYPILKRLGFVDAGRLRRLEDPQTCSGASGGRSGARPGATGGASGTTVGSSGSGSSKPATPSTSSATK